ncbi:MAG: hypothetical protein H6746_20050 [Deltaproteobacteria bacterium]|nr:hypothetical protein [Deltaproteobacteria bacterium]
MRLTPLLLALLLTVSNALAACGGSGDVEAPDADAADALPDAAPDVDTADDADTADAADAAPEVVAPRGTDESRARAFKLFYRERLDRALIAYNRFGLFGDVGFGLAVDRAHVAREGQSYDIVVGPNDNNLMGTPLRAVWHAWRHFHSRTAELTLIRMLRGLEFYEQVTGHPGLTSRMALTGWTLDIDGVAKTATRTRDGAAVTSPLATDAALEAEILATFFDGVKMKYRMNPRDTYLTFLPGWDPAEYAITQSIPNLPDFIRISDCCATLRRTPEGYPWADSWWSNHNSRDNFPDIALGVLAAMEAEASPETPEAIRGSATRVAEAGVRIADLIEANGGNIMTVDEYHDYDTLTVSGEIRPHGLPENEDLGSMASCPMALLSRALSTQGLEAAPVDVFLPGTQELLIAHDYPGLIECPFEEPRRCASIDDAICGLSWATIDELKVLDQPIFELAVELEAGTPGSAETLLGSFQNDFDDVAEAMVSLEAVLRVKGEAALADDARDSVGHLTDLMRRFADILYGERKPEKRASQRYEAAIFDAMAGREVVASDLGEFEPEDARMARAEGLLQIPEAQPVKLYTDEELLQLITDGLANLQDKSGPGRSEAIRKRYAETYPDGKPPIRRAGDAYEARQGQGPWFPAERPRHKVVGGFDLMQAVILCTTAPELLDCSWAAIGCAPPDLDQSGTVDAADLALFETAFTGYGDGATCDEANGHCGGVDLDASGTLDASDRAFMTAAQGCVR